MIIHCTLLLVFLLLLPISSLAQSSTAISLAQANAFQQTTTVGFEENKGQVWDMDHQPAPDVRYHFHQGNLNLFMLPTGMAYQFNRIQYPEGHQPYDKSQTQEQQAIQAKLSTQIRLETYRMDLQLVGANPNAKIVAEGKSQDHVNYYNRNTLNVHRFKKLTYQDIYPGIDWVIYTSKQGLKYDFVVHPGAQPDQIQLRFHHHEALQLNDDGSFTLANKMGTITEEAPISFQGTDKIATRFELQDETISFKVAPYDPKQMLVIDPNLVWATYYGGSDWDQGVGCSTDQNGNVYLTGASSSQANIASGGHQNTLSGYRDAFLVKFNSNGVRQWATYYGGVAFDLGHNCAIDQNKQIYWAGFTGSTFNIASGGHQNTWSGDYDAFLVKLDSNGLRQWGTYYGGSLSDLGMDCALDQNGHIYLAGYTASNTGIASGGHQNSSGGQSDAFLAKFNSNGVRLWGTYYGGNLVEHGYACTTDNNGNVYLTGDTGSSINIASGGHQNTLNGFYDAFLVKFNGNGVRQWATYYGGSAIDEGMSCAVDGKDNVYLVGETESRNNIALSGHQNTLGGNKDAFLVKFDGNGQRQWATYYGGFNEDDAYECAVAPNGDIYFAGSTSSSTNIASGGHQNIIGGTIDAFLVKFNSDGIRQWATYYGGNWGDYGRGCTLDGRGHIYLMGSTYSSINIAHQAHQSTLRGAREAFLAKFHTTTNINSIEQIPFSNIQLYPNPSSNILNIDLGDLPEAQAQLFSLNGQALRPARILRQNPATLDLKGLPTGVYLLHITHQHKTGVYKVVKY